MSNHIAGRRAGAACKHIKQWITYRHELTGLAVIKRFAQRIRKLVGVANKRLSQL